MMSMPTQFAFIPKFAFLLLSSFAFKIANCQTLPNFPSIKLETIKDYDSTANKAALQAADYILSVPIPIGKDNTLRVSATQYMLKWMAGTPDNNFNVDGTVEKVATENDDLVRIFLAALVKYTLENKQAAKDLNTLKLNAFKTVVNYCKNAHNNVIISGELKKLITANDKGKLAEYLKL